MKITVIGLDLAKSVFQAHGVDKQQDRSGEEVASKADAAVLLEPAACLIGVEACVGASLGAHALGDGPRGEADAASYVKGYVKRGKSDALDAEAICEAVQRRSMRFVPTKTVEQQAILMAHRTRSLLVRQRTMAANALRAHLAEFGLVANPGIANLAKLSEKALAEPDGLPAYARRALAILVRRLAELTEEIGALDRELCAWHARTRRARGSQRSRASG